MKQTPNLISYNDYKRIDKALEIMMPDSFTRTYENYTINVEVSPTGEAAGVWNAPFVITVRQNRQNVFSTQHFANTEDMKRLYKPI